ncbi:uncharacterized protein LOC143451629 [Clavelina lepadiformis]|uniref:uncharacterized protein LOC143451629 n=1 Tax=Clavelina lepadiformis TaxID=159417 RepID=UPI004041909E
MKIYWFLVAFGICLFYQCSRAEDRICPKPCVCSYTPKYEHFVFCDWDTEKNQSQVNRNGKTINATEWLVSSILADLPGDTTHLQLRNFNVAAFKGKMKPFPKLINITLVNPNMQHVPMHFLAQFKNLKYLNLSGNDIREVYFSAFANLTSLTKLDLSGNEITEAYFEQYSLIHLTHLHISNNQINSITDISNLHALEFLDLSQNPVDFVKAKLSTLGNLKTLILRGVQTVSNVHQHSCGLNTGCQILPRRLNVIDLGGSSLYKVPSCNGLLAGLHNLTHLYMEGNEISIIDENTFQSYCFANLKLISLANNSLVQISEHSLLKLNYLTTLVVTNNYLQHIPVNLLQKLSSNGAIDHNKIVLHSNPWSCDCFQKEVHQWLQEADRNVPVKCYFPESLRGQYLENLSVTQLECSEVWLHEPYNTTANEYNDGYVSCYTSGTPKPLVMWFTPSGEEISLGALLNDDALRIRYSLSAYGEVLTVRDVRLDKTGLYRCVANNTISTANQTTAMGVILSNTSTIIYVVIACVSFMVAIVLNSVNMCMYMYEHYKARRQLKKKLHQQEEEEKENPPIRSRSKTLDESMASLNANRHYGRYDFTCQQLFLDSVVKGAYTVKKTLYDARHSEFSLNMWEYAANLRDRLHIEMPSMPSGVQLPSISMPSISIPSISMPTISMPSIPTMQDINTNIEKLGTSVMHRSHNLASSVGSVFTLKRWMWQNPSDTESRNSDEQLAGDAGFTEVLVDVHKSSNTINSSEGGSTSKLDHNVLTNNRDEKFEENKPYNFSKTTSLPYYMFRKPIVTARVQKHKTMATTKMDKPEKTVRFGTEGFSPHNLPHLLEHCEVKIVQQPIISENPALHTISAVVEGCVHSYETSV